MTFDTGLERRVGLGWQRSGMTIICSGDSMNCLANCLAGAGNLEGGGTVSSKAGKISSQQKVLRVVSVYSKDMKVKRMNLRGVNRRE